MLFSCFCSRNSHFQFIPLFNCCSYSSTLVQMLWQQPLVWLAVQRLHPLTGGWWSSGAWQLLQNNNTSVWTERPSVQHLQGGGKLVTGVCLTVIWRRGPGESVHRRPWQWFLSERKNLGCEVLIIWDFLDIKIIAQICRNRTHDYSESQNEFKRHKTERETAV